MTPRCYPPLLPLLLTCLAVPVQAVFTDNGDGTVTDTTTGLMWDQCAWGLSGNTCAAGSVSQGTWQQALGVAVTANNQNNGAGYKGHNDWRLPNRTELVSLVDYTKFNPAIDTAVFPNTPNNAYWTSTVYAPLPTLQAWSLEFASGYPGSTPQNATFNVVVRLVRGGKSYGAFDRWACGDGIPYANGQWQMLALPCVTVADPASPATVFGDSPTLANLDSASYNVATTGWVMYRREVGTTPSSYVKLLSAGNIDTTGGYWLKSGTAAVNNQLTVAGTGPVAPNVTQANGCAVTSSCKAVTVTTVNGNNRYNLVGNPFPYAVNWSNVRIRVGGAGGTIYTPSQAQAADILSNQIWIWNGSAYQTWDDTVQPGNLQYFKSFWVNVLPGAFGLTVELLIPAEKSNLSQASPAVEPGALPWYLAWLDLVAPPAQAGETALRQTLPNGLAMGQAAVTAADNWQVRLKLDNHVTGAYDHTNLLGQWQGAQPGYDSRDLVEMAPFAKPFLTLGFPHPEWGPKAGDYATDFRPALGNPPQDWTFEVRADPIGGVAFIRWEGDTEVLRRSRLIDLQTGKTIQPAAANWAGKGYPIPLKNPVQRYTWRYLGK